MDPIPNYSRTDRLDLEPETKKLVNAQRELKWAIRFRKGSTTIDILNCFSKEMNEYVKAYHQLGYRIYVERMEK